MDKHFEKILIILMALSFISLPFLDHYAQASENGLLPPGSPAFLNEYPGITRFHIIANSDSTEDQDLKLKVRDYVLEKIQTEIAEELALNNSSSQKGTIDNIGEEQIVIRRYMENNLPKIEEWAAEIIADSDMCCDVSASFGVRHIPAKYYGELLFPEGNYEALTITIGEGKGQNWWCVVLPPLCLIDSSNEETSSEYNFNENENVLLKFKTQELIQEINENNNRNACLNLLTSTLSLIQNTPDEDLTLILKNHIQQN